ncbi:hypothetical protein B1748_28150 [Paenibacillus sp. MY03]|uniref:response regulator transcription factor n=1 Tax=Paenibacillus sp. MY03 TaxID=302980 RepID=UPI000B3D338B|nr:helix-turn-helix domain-containing protein [Paenibacillus sp. MY03]OUS70621.1 hypothetical protein B1748_28150 [Paenibacillus sp. MY03]
MYRVMLVDDDYPVIEYLQQAIPWQALNMEVIGGFSNGQKAYDYATNLPDILLTDIGMPVMNGLELINALTLRKKNLRSIILSCHDEFSFAMQAIKLNVVDYILKESLDPVSLIKLLEQMKHSLDEEKTLKKQEVSKELITSLEDNPLLDEAAWADQTDQIGLDFRTYVYIPVLCVINRQQVAEKRYSSKKLLSFSMQNVIEEVVAKEKEQGIFHLSYNGKETVLLFQYRDLVKTNVYESLEGTLRTINDAIKDYLKFSVTFIVGTNSENATSLKSNIKQLLKGKDHCFYRLEGSILKLDALDYQYSEEDLFIHHVEATEHFQQLIMKEDVENLKRKLAYWIALIRETRYKPQVVREWGLKILLDLRMKIKSLHYFETRFSEEVVHQNLFWVESLDHFQDMMWTQLADLLHVVQYINTSSKRREIIEAQRYVMEHLHEKISMSEVAQRLHLNASYFSRLFKKETNENFVDYVLRLKMERACEYLDHSDYSIEQISDRLGFDSKSYFIRTFRREIGMLPTAYRHKI